MRIEDTDKSREVAGAAENIQATLKTFKLSWDEGPYFQSERLKIYQEHAEILLQKGAAYKCHCSAERIAELKKEAELLKQPFRYDKHCLKNPRPQDGKFVIRQNVPEEGRTSFADLVHGEIKIENRLLDDGVLVKSDGWPVYNFANVIDDHLMEITHVIRGEEFIPSTPKHVLLYQAFGWTPPEFAHLPLILDRNRKKLSKRTSDVAVKEYLDKGYLPEALANFIAFLGWNPKTQREIFSLEELIAEFDLKKVNKAGAIFDLEKLRWFNAHYIKQKSSSELLDLLYPYFPAKAAKYPQEFLQRVAEIEKERLEVASEIGERIGYFFREPEYQKELLRWKKMTDQEIRLSLEQAQKMISNIKEQSTKQALEQMFFKKIGTGDKGILLWPLRVALTGSKASPGPFEIMEAFLILENGRETILRRIEQAIAKLKKM